MNKKSKKIIEEKQKSELNATTIVMTTKQLRQGSKIESDKSPRINKNTD